MHVHQEDDVIPPRDGSDPQSGCLEDSRAVQTRTLAVETALFRRARVATSPSSELTIV